MTVKRISDNAKYFAKDFFIYEINITTALAAAGQTQGTVTIDNDADFEWQKASAHVAVASDGTTRNNEQIPEIDVIIRDTTSGRDLMNVQVPMRNIFGTGEIPFILPVTKIFPARSTIQVQFFNVSDNTTYSSIKISFIGGKLFLR